MKSKVETPWELQREVLAYVERQPCYSDVRPQKFISLLENNHATTDELGSDGLYLRSPLIVALGDSVTAGWFEGNTRFPREIRERFFADAEKVEHVTDVSNVYHEQFRLMLAERYERISASVINSGVSGDTVSGMLKRLERDLLRYDPNLVLLHASLNGPEDVDVYARDLEEIILRIQGKTEAEIVVITPNLILDEAMGTLEERVEVMLDCAQKYHLAVAHQYALWKVLKQSGFNIRMLLSNGLNHPNAFGHRIAALELMKLMG